LKPLAHPHYRWAGDERIGRREDGSHVNMAVENGRIFRIWTIDLLSALLNCGP